MGLNILIVDDSAVTRKVLIRTINMTGMEVDAILEAANGREALDKLRDFPVDLVLADLNMPEMAGQELTERVLADERTRHIPVVIISTEASPTRIGALREHGIRQYLHKPFTPEAIRALLQEVTSQQFIDTEGR